MDIQKIHENPDVFRVVVPFTGPGIDGTNCYVVRDGGETLVVDTGAPSDEAFAVLSGALDELGADRGRTGFFLTHFHIDHAGLIDRIAPPDAPVYVSRADFACMQRGQTPAYRADLFERLEREGVPADELGEFRRLTFSSGCFDDARHRVVFTKEGDAVRCGRWEFRTVETPGHTAGHQSLLHPGSGLFFGGDLILFAITPSIDFSPYGTDGLGRFLESVERVRGLPVSLLCHSHGELRPDWRERAAWLAEHRTARLGHALDAVRLRGACSMEGRGRCFGLAEGVDAAELDRADARERAVSGCTGYEAVRGIRWNVPFEEWEHVSLVQRWAIVGEGLVYLDRLVETGRVARSVAEGGTHRYSVV